MMYKLVFSLALVLALSGAAMAQNGAERGAQEDDDRRSITIVKPEGTVVIEVDGEEIRIIEHDNGVVRRAPALRLHMDSLLAPWFAHPDRPAASLREWLPEDMEQHMERFRQMAQDDTNRVFLFGPRGFPAEVIRERVLGSRGDIARMAGRFRVLAEEQAEIAQMEVRARRLAERVQQAEGAERQRLESELEQELREIFDRRQELRQQRIQQIEDELQREREQYDQRQARRQDMIERRKQELLREEDALDW